MKKIIYLLIPLTLLVVIFLPNKTNKENKITITTTNYMVEYLLNSIAQDTVKVINIIPNEADFHEYELTTKNIEDILDSDYLYILSQDTESYLDIIKESINNQETNLQIEELVANLTDISSEDKINNNQLKDYHLWTSPKKLLQFNEIVYKKLIEISPQNEEIYQQNYQKNLTKLEEISKEFQTLPSDKTYYVLHNAFYWLAKDYDLNIKGILPQDEHAEITSKELTDVMKTIKNEKIKIIYNNSEQNNDIIEQIQKETNVEIGVLDHLETRIENEDYFQRLENNYQEMKKVND